MYILEFSNSPILTSMNSYALPPNIGTLDYKDFHRQAVFRTFANQTPIGIGEGFAS